MGGARRTAREYAILSEATLGRRAYCEVCRRLTLDVTPCGYGALLCRDERGRGTCLLTTDLEYLHMIVEAAQQCPAAEGSRGIPVDGAKFPIQREVDLGALLGDEVVAT
jgi:hypothetical protein